MTSSHSKVPDAYFGFIQLSTWCATLIPEMRATQMQAFEKLENIGYATNADHGAGCNIHPPPKQYVRQHRLFVNSRTLMGCPDPLRRGVGAPPSFPPRVGSRLPTNHLC